MSFGFVDNFWMARKLIENGHPVLVKRAVIAVINHLEQVENSGTSPLRILEMLVQITAAGEYVEQPHDTPLGENVHRTTIHVGEDASTEEILAEVQKYLDGLPTAEDPNGDFDLDEFHRTMGIPTEDDEAEKTDDDLPYEEWLIEDDEGDEE